MTALLIIAALWAAFGAGTIFGGLTFSEPFDDLEDEL